MGGTKLEGFVTEASAARPYLAACLALPPDAVARTLLALTDANRATPSPTLNDGPPAPAFVGKLEAAVESAMVRLLKSLDDPLECKVLAPLIIDELIFRLLRSDAARFVRGAVTRAFRKPCATCAKTPRARSPWRRLLATWA